MSGGDRSALRRLVSVLAWTGGRCGAVYKPPPSPIRAPIKRASCTLSPGHEGVHGNGAYWNDDSPGAGCSPWSPEDLELLWDIVGRPEEQES